MRITSAALLGACGLALCGLTIGMDRYIEGTSGGDDQSVAYAWQQLVGAVELLALGVAIASRLLEQYLAVLVSFGIECGLLAASNCEIGRAHV